LHTIASVYILFYANKKVFRRTPALAGKNVPKPPKTAGLWRFWHAETAPQTRPNQAEKLKRNQLIKKQ